MQITKSLGGEKLKKLPMSICLMPIESLQNLYPDSLYALCPLRYAKSPLIHANSKKLRRLEA